MIRDGLIWEKKGGVESMGRTPDRIWAGWDLSRPKIWAVLGPCDTQSPPYQAVIIPPGLLVLYAMLFPPPAAMPSPSLPFALSRYRLPVDGRIYSPRSALSSRSRDPIPLDFPSDRNERVISHSMTLSRVVEPGLYPLERTLSYSSRSRNPIFVLI